MKHESFTVINSPESIALLDKAYISPGDVRNLVGCRVIRTKGGPLNFRSTSDNKEQPLGLCDQFIKLNDAGRQIRDMVFYIPAACLRLVTTKRRNASVAKRPKGKLVRFTKSEREYLAVALATHNQDGTQDSHEAEVVATLRRKLK